MADQIPEWLIPPEIATCCGRIKASHRHGFLRCWPWWLLTPFQGEIRHDTD